MLYQKVKYSTILDMVNKPLWFAKFSDHPKYTLEHEVFECLVSDLVVLPTKVEITDYEIFKHHSLSIIDLSVQVGSTVYEYKFSQENEFPSQLFNQVVEHGLILGETQQEVSAEYQKQLIQLIEEYIEFNDRERVQWYTECLEYVNPTKAMRYVDKHPELFV